MTGELKFTVTPACIICLAHTQNIIAIGADNFPFCCFPETRFKLFLSFWTIDFRKRKSIKLQIWRRFYLCSMFDKINYTMDHRRSGPSVLNIGHFKLKMGLSAPPEKSSSERNIDFEIFLLLYRSMHERESLWKNLG